MSNDFHKDFANMVIETIETRTAPWMQSWSAGEMAAPFNPISTQTYGGVNLIKIVNEQANEQLQSDPRFFLAKQVKEMGLEIQKDAIGIELIYYYDGSKYGDAQRTATYETVYPASAIKGIAPWDGLDLHTQFFTHTPSQLVEILIQGSGAQIIEGQAHSARRIPNTIQMPPREQFADEKQYYSTALHELARWTGDPDRLNRQVGPFGSEQYAKEELRTTIATWAMCAEFGLPFEPSPTAKLYHNDWIQLLQKEPEQLFQILSDVKEIYTHCRCEIVHAKKQERDTSQRSPALNLLREAELIYAARLDAQIQLKLEREEGNEGKTQKTQRVLHTLAEREKQFYHTNFVSIPQHIDTIDKIIHLHDTVEKNIRDASDSLHMAQEKQDNAERTLSLLREKIASREFFKDAITNVQITPENSEDTQENIAYMRAIISKAPSEEEGIQREQGLLKEIKELDPIIANAEKNISACIAERTVFQASIAAHIKQDIAQDCKVQREQASPKLSQPEKAISTEKQKTRQKSSQDIGIDF